MNLKLMLSLLSLPQFVYFNIGDKPPLLHAHTIKDGRYCEWRLHINVKHVGIFLIIIKKIFIIDDIILIDKLNVVEETLCRL